MASTRYKVYVMLGFHTSFYHSWRGDTPDEAGFGTDIRVVRQILRILDEANREGLQARGYWDFDVYWTLQEILPRHALDIVEGIRQRLRAGQDEIVLGPYNNGANHAATERELRVAVSYAIENPYGSGLKQLFGQATSVYRSQECMHTAGQNAILLDEGVSGLVLYYAGVPFNTLSTFVPALPPEQRYNLLQLRLQPGEPPLTVWPCISPADLVEEVCLEALMLKLRRLQTSGQVQSDLLIHLNYDADGETWLPAEIPKAFSWFPNTGGLVEYIRAVNRYPWAEFTVPSEYERDHKPQTELLVRQDLADGGFDGNYSWVEKYTSLSNWTALERSRLYTYRAEALAGRLPASLAEELHRRLWEGQDSAFFQRLVGLSTTHFGMSTPVINEERQARAEQLLGEARDRAARAEREAARALRSQHQAGEEALYAFEVYRSAYEGHEPDETVRAMVRLPIILPPGVAHVKVQEAEGEPIAASLVNVQQLLDGSLAGELMFSGEFPPSGSQIYRVTPAPTQTPPPPSLDRLRNRGLDLCLSEKTGIASLTFEGQEIGGSNFLEPFITYRNGKRPQSWFASGYTFDDLTEETWDGISRACIRTCIAMDTPHGPMASGLRFTFTLFDGLPYLLVDVEVSYASTPRADTVHNIQQKLRRLLDLRWIEVAPCQLHPTVTAPAGKPLRVWKHNYLGVTSYYDLEYGRINPRNGELDSFNHQVTAGWVAVSNGQIGLLLAENAETLASMAFCPMRLRERDGVQHLSLNPFGSYYGRQLDYSHLGGKGVGAEFTAAVSGALRPNGPSYNGQRLAFSLLLAPYLGDAPPVQVQADALAHFYPMGVIYHQTPPGLDAVVPADIRQWIVADERKRQQVSDVPLPAPRAFLANPSDGAVDLVWEEPRDAGVTGFEVRWRTAGEGEWHTEQVPPGNRWQVDGLRNRQRYAFQVRALAEGRQSAWTAEAEAMPGAVAVASLLSMIPENALGTLVRMVAYSLAHVLSARLWRLRSKT